MGLAELFQRSHSARQQRIKDVEQQREDERIQEESNLLELDAIKKEADAAEREPNRPKESFFSRVWNFIKNKFTFSKEKYSEGRDKERDEEDNFQDFLIQKVTFEQGYSSYANNANSALALIQNTDNVSNEDGNEIAEAGSTAVKREADFSGDSISRSRSEEGDTVGGGVVDVVYKNKFKLIKPTANFKAAVLGTNSVEYTTSEGALEFMGEWHNTSSAEPIKLYHDFTNNTDKLFAPVSIKDIPLGTDILSINNLLIRDSAVATPDYSFIGGTAGITSDVYDVALSAMSVTGNSFDNIKAKKADITVKKGPVELQKTFTLDNTVIGISESTKTVISDDARTNALKAVNFNNFVSAVSVDIGLCHTDNKTDIVYDFNSYRLYIDKNPWFTLKGENADCSVSPDIDGSIHLNEGGEYNFSAINNLINIDVSPQLDSTGYVLGHEAQSVNFTKDTLEIGGVALNGAKIILGREGTSWKANVHLDEINCQEAAPAVIKNVDAVISDKGLEIASAVGTFQPSEEYLPEGVDVLIEGLAINSSGVTFKKATGSVGAINLGDKASFTGASVTLEKEEGKSLHFNAGYTGLSFSTDAVPNIKLDVNGMSASYDSITGMAFSGSAKAVFGDDLFGIDAQNFSYSEGSFGIEKLEGSGDLNKISGTEAIKGDLLITGSNIGFGAAGFKSGGIKASLSEGSILGFKLPDISMNLDADNNFALGLNALTDGEQSFGDFSVGYLAGSAVDISYKDKIFNVNLRNLGLTAKTPHLLITIKDISARQDNGLIAAQAGAVLSGTGTFVDGLTTDITNLSISSAGIDFDKIETTLNDVRVNETVSFKEAKFSINMEEGKPIHYGASMTGFSLDSAAIGGMEVSAGDVNADYDSETGFTLKGSTKAAFAGGKVSVELSNLAYAEKTLSIGEVKGAGDLSALTGTKAIEGILTISAANITVNDTGVDKEALDFNLTGTKVAGLTLPDIKATLGADNSFTMNLTANNSESFKLGGCTIGYKEGSSAVINYKDKAVSLKLENLGLTAESEHTVLDLTGINYDETGLTIASASGAVRGTGTDFDKLKVTGTNLSVSKTEGVRYDTLSLVADGDFNFFGGKLLVKSPSLTIHGSKENMIESITAGGSLAVNIASVTGEMKGISITFNKADKFVPKLDKLEGFSVTIADIGLLSIGNISTNESEAADDKSAPNSSLLFEDMELKGNLDKKKLDAMDDGSLKYKIYSLLGDFSIKLAKAEYKDGKFDYSKNDISIAKEEFNINIGDFHGSINTKTKKVALEYTFKAPKDQDPNSIPEQFKLEYGFPCLPTPISFTVSAFMGAKFSADFKFEADYGQSDKISTTVSSDVNGAAKGGVGVGLAIGVPSVASLGVSLKAAIVATIAGNLTGNADILIDKTKDKLMDRISLDKKSLSLDYLVKGALEGKISVSVSASVLKVFSKDLYSVDLASFNFGTFSLKGGITHNAMGYVLKNKADFTTDINKDAFDPDNPDSPVKTAVTIKDEQQKLDTMLDNCGALGFEEERGRFKSSQSALLQNNILEGLDKIVKIDNDAFASLKKTDSKIAAAMIKAKSFIAKHKDRQMVGKKFAGDIGKAIETLGLTEDTGVDINSGKVSSKNMETYLQKLNSDTSIVEKLSGMDPLAALGALRVAFGEDSMLFGNNIWTSKNVQMAKELSIKASRLRAGLEETISPDAQRKTEEAAQISQADYSGKQAANNRANDILLGILNDSVSKKGSDREKIGELSNREVQLLKELDEHQAELLRYEEELEELQNKKPDTTKMTLKDKKKSEETQKTLERKKSAAVADKKKKIEETRVNIEKNKGEMQKAREVYYSVSKDKKSEDYFIKVTEGAAFEFGRLRNEVGIIREDYIEKASAKTSYNDKGAAEGARGSRDDEVLIRIYNRDFLNAVISKINPGSLNAEETEQRRLSIESIKKGKESDMIFGRDVLKNLYSTNSANEAVDIKDARIGDEETVDAVTLADIDKHAQNRIKYYSDRINSIEDTRKTLEESIIWAGKRYSRALGMFKKLQDMNTESMVVKYADVDSPPGAITEANQTFKDNANAMSEGGELDERAVKDREAELRRIFNGEKTEEYFNNKAKELEME